MYRLKSVRLDYIKFEQNKSIFDGKTEIHGIFFKLKTFKPYIDFEANIKKKLSYYSI